MSHQAEKQHVRASVKLKEQEVLIEKSLEYFFTNMKIDPDIKHNLKQECKFLSDERYKIESVLYSKALEIGSSFETIRSIVNQSRNGVHIDIDDCQNKMKDLLEKIEEFDIEAELEVLEKQQKELDDILIEFKINLSKYGTEKSISANGLKISHSKSESKEIYDDTENYSRINDFYSLIVKTGHTQHWTEKDHMHFVNVRKKCTSIPELVNAIQKQCPDLSVEKIVNHEAWYKIYLNLREEQRKCVNEWRKQKELDEKKKKEVIKNNEIDKTETKDKQGIDGGKFCTSVDESSKIASSSEKINGNIIAPKELIKQWKIQKQNAKLADEERLKLQSEAVREWKEKKFSMRAMQIREAVAKYQDKKNEKKSELLFINNMKSNAIIKSPALVESLRKKDKDFLNRRKNLIEMKYQKLKMNHFNINVTNNCPRSLDQSTLMKPTKIWNEKCKRRTSSEQSPIPILYIKDLPKLSHHNWRNQTSISLV